MHLEIVREMIIKNNPRLGWRETKKVDCVATAGVVPRLLVQQKPTLYIRVITRCDCIDCEVFNTSHSNVRHL